MAYVEIVKGKFGSATVPRDVLRITRSTTALAENIAENFQLTRTTNPKAQTDYEVVSIGIAVDTENKSIKLVPGSVNGYTWAAKGNTKTLIVATPKSFWRTGMPAGDYVCTNPRTLEFQLAE